MCGHYSRLLLTRLGMFVRRDAAGDIHLETIDRAPVRADRQLVARMRASFCVLGPLVARRHKAIVPSAAGRLREWRPADRFALARARGTRR